MSNLQDVDAYDEDNKEDVKDSILDTLDWDMHQDDEVFDVQHMCILCWSCIWHGIHGIACAANMEIEVFN